MKKPSLDGITIKLEVQIFKQGGYFIAYAPALELSSYGNSEEDAKLAFEDALEIFLEDTLEKGTLHQILSELGWTFKNHNLVDKVPSMSSKTPKQSPVYSTTSVDFRVPACL